MQRGDVKTLAQLIYTRRQEGEEPYVLFLGSDVLLSPQRQTWDQLVIRTLKSFGEYSRYSSTEQCLRQFYLLMSTLDRQELCRWLSSCLEPIKPSEGHRYLAELVKRGYFKTVISTNIDTLLEKALADVGLGHNAFGVLRPGELVPSVRFPWDPIPTSYGHQVQIIKLHGDIHGSRFKLTPSEPCLLTMPLRIALSDVFGKDIIMVGYDKMRDADLVSCIPWTDNDIWYIDFQDPTEAGSLVTILERRGSHYYSGVEADFDTFFKRLERLVESKEFTHHYFPGQPIVPRAQQKREQRAEFGTTARRSAEIIAEEEAAYAVARIKDHEIDAPFVIGEEYMLQTGILSEVPKGFEGVPVSFDDAEVLEVQVVVSAQDMEVSPSRFQTLHFLKGQDSDLVEFLLKPTSLGEKEICIEFYYRQHWLQMLKIKVEVIEPNNNSLIQLIVRLFSRHFPKLPFYYIL